MKTLLFLCTGNYYRSRFAEMYFQHLADRYKLTWRADSRGLRLHPGNVGPISEYTVSECQRFGIVPDLLRWPMQLVENDLRAAELVIAVKELEHRPLMQSLFPDWEHRVEYWDVHDVDFAPSHEALPQLQKHVEGLVERLLTQAKQPCP